METSAKTGLNSKEIFMQGARMLYNDYLLYKELNPNDKTIAPMSRISLPKFQETEESIIKDPKHKACKC